MKKFILLILSLVLALALFADVTIGSGTSTSSVLPINCYYGYSYTQQIYTQAQIGGAMSITGLRFYFSSGSTTNSSAWVIRLGHTTKTTFSSTTDWEAWSGLTEVYNGNLTLPTTAGWWEINFTTPFAYNGTNNLVIAIDENTSGYSAGSAYWYSFTSGTNTGIYYYNDTTNPDPTAPPTANSRTSSINQVVLLAPVVTPPNPAGIIAPADGATYVGLTPTLSWVATSGNPTGYKLYFGPTGSMAYIGDLGLVTSWTPPAALANDTNYSWKVVPYNAYGDATGCPTWTFTTVPPGLVPIGTGTLTQRYPFGIYFGYERAAGLYTSAQIGTTGVLDQILWNCATSSTTAVPYKIYAKNTTDTALTAQTWDAFVGTMTLVDQGTYTFSSTGWHNFALDTPFTVNGTNLIIAVETFYGGTGTSPYPYFYYSTGATASAEVWYADTTPPATAGTVGTNLPNVMLHIGAAGAGAPAAPILSYPADAATGLPKAGFNLSWTPDLINGGTPTYYAVYMATTEEDIYSQYYWETNDTFTNPVTQGGVPFSYLDRWFWTVEAVNTNGSAVVEPPHWFEIEADPRISLPHTQDFTGATIPANWTQTYADGVTSARWAISATNVAGGTMNEMKATWLSGTGISRLITPPINTTGVSNMNVNFNQFFDDYGAGVTAKLQYSHDLSTWIDTGYAITSGGGDVTGNTSVLITGLAAPLTYVAWVLDGNHYQFDYWYVDDVNLTLPLAHDVAVLSIDMPEVVQAVPLTPKATVKNFGVATETFTVQMQIGAYTSTQTVTGLASGASQQVSFTPLTPTLWTANSVTVATQLGTDLNAANNSMTGALVCLDMNYQAYCDVAYDPTSTYSGPATFMLHTPGSFTDLPSANPWSGSFLAGADWMNGGWYGAQYDDGTLTTDNWWMVDTTTGAGTDLGDTGVGLTGVAYDPSNGILYGSSATNLYTLDPATGVATLVGPFGPAWPGTMIGIAFDYMNMVLYGVDLGYDALFTIDPATGTATAVGGLGIGLNYAQDIAFDGNTGLLYLAGYTATGALYWVDTVNGGAYKVGNFANGAEVTGFAIPWNDGIASPVVAIAADGTLSWAAIPGATVYHVYGSDDPYGAFTLLGNTATTSWLDPAFPEGMKFYHVTADTAVIRGNHPIQGLENLRRNQPARSLTPVKSGVAKPQPK